MATYENTIGLDVFSRFGPPGTENGLVSGGKVKALGTVQEAIVYVTSDDFGTDETYDTQFIIPAESILIDAVFEVGTDITQTGGTTSLALHVGTAGSEATNGFSISDAATTLSATTELDESGAGTWATAQTTGFAADTTIGIALVAGGGTITSVDGGAAKITVRFYKS